MKLTFQRYLFVTILFALLFSANLHAQTNPRRFHYMGTSIFNMPTGFTRSTACYINDAGHSAMLLSQVFMNRFVEFSMLKHMNGAESGNTVTNFKVKILEQDLVIPSVVWGVSDLNKQLGSRIFYFAASKSIDAFGVQLHAGMYKDPISTDKRYYFGFEKMVFPLVTIGAERNDEVNTFGIKLSPYPGLSLEIAQRDSREEMYNLNYIRSF
ncbi:MAG: hypothetical protein ACQETH_02835 [Candidatus Rifleibacteriota bacterium]